MAEGKPLISGVTSWWRTADIKDSTVDKYGPSESLIKTTAGAQSAYGSGDGDKSRALHEAAKEDHGGFGSDYVKSIVFGGLDGVITTFSTIASSYGGRQEIRVVIILGLANLVADALSMGVGDFISSSAEFSYAVSEKKREEWEYDNLPAGERAEMVEKLVEEKSFERHDAERIIGIIGAHEHRDFFIDYMMHEELGLEAPDDPWAPAKDGTTTFISFMVFGSVPLLIYIFCYAANIQKQDIVFGIASAFTVITLFALGALQGAITRLNMVQSGTYMAVIGSLATASAFAVGYGLAAAVPPNQCGAAAGPITNSTNSTNTTFF